MQETGVQSLSRRDTLEKEMETYSSIFAWRIPWTEEPGGLQSTGSQRVGHNLMIKQQQQAFLKPQGSLWFAVGRDSTSQAQEGRVADSGGWGLLGAFLLQKPCVYLKVATTRRCFIKERAVSKPQGLFLCSPSLYSPS